MIKEYQVTLYNKENKYKPVSCIIKHEEIDLHNKEEKKKLVEKGVKKICAKRYWTNRELRKYAYLVAKVREYKREEIVKK